jgi:hypothetical protein
MVERLTRETKGELMRALEVAQQRLCWMRRAV